MNVRDLWQQRSPSERRIVAAAGTIVVGLLLIALVWLPLERARSRLSAELPELRQSLASLQRDADEVKRLRSMPVAAAAASGPLSGLASATPLPGARIALVDDKRVRITAPDVAFNALLDWLAAVRATHGLRVESARLEGLAQNGRVRAEITLSRS